MSIFITTNNEFKIELERNNIKLLNTGENISYQYKCSFKIFNIFNIEIINIITTEIDIFNFLDCVYQYIEFNQSDIFISFNLNNTLNKYIFHFMKDPNNFNNDILIISQNDIDRIKIYFDNDIEIHSLSHFLDLIYFTFLIDLDNGFYVNTDFLK